MKVGLLVVASVAALAGCSSYDAAADAPGGSATDGGFLPDGAPAPLTGTPTADLELQFDAVRVVHGTTLGIPFTVTRGNFYDGEIALTVSGLPPTITTPGVTINGRTSSGEISLVVTAQQAQGALTGVTIEAQGQTGARPHASKPLDLFVRGKAGELDTTFANNGVLTVGNTSLGSEFDIDDTGRLLVMNDTTLRRFDADGKTAEPAFTVTFPSEKSALVTRRGDSIFVGRNSSADGGAYGGWLTKLSSTGAKDLAYGAGSGATKTFAFEITAFGIDIDGRSVTLYPEADGGCWDIPLLPNGQSAGSSNLFKHPQFARAAVYLADHSLLIGGDAYLTKLLTNNSVDSTFGTAGSISVDAALKINDMLIDGSGQYLVTGQGAGGALYLARVTTSGTVDTTFPSVASPYAAKAETLTFKQLFTGDYTSSFAGHIALDSERNILQAGQVDDGGVVKCAVVRYSKTGVVDSTFGASGLTKLDAPGCYAHRIKAQPDGRIIVGGPVLMRLWN